VSIAKDKIFSGCGKYEQQNWGGYILYLDTSYLDTVFNVTVMYLDTVANFSNVTATFTAKISECQIHFRYIIILNTHICNWIF